MTKLAGLSIVLPCFNEEENLVAAVGEALVAARRVADEHEIVVVDDGSRDLTGMLATELAKEHWTVRVVTHESNEGYGAALRSGIAHASMPWILLTDGDRQFDLTQLDAFLPYTGDHDLLLGWRLQRMDPLGRRVAARAWNALVDAVFALEVRDVDCAFKLMRTELVKDMPLRTTGAMISTELVVRARDRGAHIQEIGVHHRPRQAGRQSGTNPRVVARAFRELLSARREYGAQTVHPPVKSRVAGGAT